MKLATGEEACSPIWELAGGELVTGEEACSPTWELAGGELVAGPLPVAESVDGDGSEGGGSVVGGSPILIG